jgi:hypothetical protein
MTRRTGSFKIALALLLAVGAYQAAAAPACVSEAASAAIVVSTVPTSSSECVQSWASIKPADFKEPIENPHSLSWQDWILVLSVPGALVVLAAVAVRLARGRAEAL